MTFRLRFFGVCLALAAPFAALAAEPLPEQLKDVGITEKLGQSVAIHELKFRDEAGQPVTLSKYFASGKPVMLNLVYFSCPHLCTFVLNGTVDSLKKFEWTPGEQFEMVSVSIDPTETAELAAKKKESYLESLGKPAAAKGWHFLTGEESQIKRLASEIGFGYRYEASEKQYAHAAANFVLTPEGKISRILYGIEYAQKDLRLSLVEASNGKIGTIVDRFLLFCYRYDPVTRKYSIYLTKIMQAGCAATILVFGGYLALFWRRQRRDQVKAAAAV